MRKRMIKKIGGSYFIHISKEDMRDFDFSVGDEIDLEDVSKIMEEPVEESDD
jgi:hypothetical protein